MKITARTPTRIDIAGGTLDLVPVHRLLQHATTVNIGISLYASVTLEPSPSKQFEIVSVDQGENFSGTWEQLLKPEAPLPLLRLLVRYSWHDRLPPLRLVTQAESPAGAGLGGSSCLGIAVGAALRKARSKFEALSALPEDKLVEFVKDIETEVIRVPTGCQDYWGGVRGNLNMITFPPGGTIVETIPLAHVQQLQDQLVICYSGKSRASGGNNWEIFKLAFGGDVRTLRALDEIGQVTEKLCHHARTGAWDEVLALSQQEWRLRTTLWPNIETTETKALDAAARQAGALFSRVCGAGGGGVMAVFCKPAVRDKVIKSLTATGGQVLPAHITAHGLEVREH